MTLPTSPSSFASLRNVIGQELFWRQQNRLRLTYELRQGEIVYASLNVMRAHILGFRGELTAPEGKWSFQQRGLWRRWIAITETASNDEVASFAQRWSGGVINFAAQAAERAYIFRRQTVFSDKWLWLTPQETPIMRVKTSAFADAHTGCVVVEPTGDGAPALSLLAGLGWYQIFLVNTASMIGAR